MKPLRFYDEGKMNRKVWLLIGFFCFIMVFPVYAGNINEDEKSIVEVANSQFEKDGVIYQVKPEYINSAMNYLNQDDVDLTSGDVQIILGEVYANVQTGVESGYLMEVGRKDVVQNGTSTKPKSLEGSEQQAGVLSEESPTEIGVPDKEGEKTEAKSAPVAISILELMDSMPGQSYDYISEDTDQLMEKLNVSFHPLQFILVSLSIVLTVIGIVCIWEKCFASHHHRKLRTVLKVGLRVGLFCFVLLAELLLGLGIGALQDGAVLNRLNKTEYYRTIYRELRHDTEISFVLMNIPNNVMDGAITYERVVMAARQQVESTLHRGSYQANTALLTERLEQDVRNYFEEESIELTDKAEVGLDLMVERLNQKYTNLLQWPFASWWANLMESWSSFMKIAGSISGLMLIIAQLLLFWIHHYRHWAMRSCGGQILLASIATMLVGGLPLVSNVVRVREITPEYMSQFFYVYEKGILLAIVAVGTVGFLVGLGYLLMAGSWKERE